METKHLFVTLIPRIDDPFWGFKNYFKRNLPADFCELSLPNDMLLFVKKVEYSKRRFFRFFFYKRVYDFLYNEIYSFVNLNPHAKTVIYFSDEGVWGEFLNTIRNKLFSFNIITVNVQHGLHYLETTPRSIYLRRFINYLSTSLLGFPSYGYGFGGSKFDVYFVYGSLESSQLYSNNVNKVFIEPHLIKSKLISEYNNYIPTKKYSVLFALEPVVPASGFSCNELQLYKSLLPLFKLIYELTNTKILLRIHPGMNQESTLLNLNNSALVQYCDIDKNKSVAFSLKSVDYVFSFHSTVLFEAFVLNKIAVQITNTCESRLLHLPIKNINLDSPNFYSDLNNIFVSNVPEFNTLHEYYNSDILVEFLSYLSFKDGFNNEK